MKNRLWTVRLVQQSFDQEFTKKKLIHSEFSTQNKKKIAKLNKSFDFLLYRRNVLK